MENRLAELSAVLENVLKVEIILAALLAVIIVIAIKNILLLQKLQVTLTDSVEYEKSEIFNGDQAEKLFEKGDIKALTDYCDTYAKDMPNSVHISWYYGLSYFNLGNYELAREYFEQVIRINPLWRDGASVYLQEIHERIGGMSDKSIFH